MSTRKSLSKKLRFEVFKRDSFACQYCGAAAPEALLVVDHIRPVVEGGSDELLNLITACQPCNAGKGPRELDDTSVVQKQRRQLEELQERREQLDMMLDWKSSLRDMKNAAAERLLDYWRQLTPGWDWHESAQEDIRRLNRKYGASIVLEAMDTAADQYLRFDSGGRATEASVDYAWGKLSGISFVKHREQENPGIGSVYHARALLRHSLAASKSGAKEIARGIDDVVANGCPVHELVEQVQGIDTWEAFWRWLARWGGDS